MFGDGPLTFREFAMREPLPLANVHDVVLEFLRGRTDAVLCGAHAVNAYVDEPRMTDDVDLLSPQPARLAADVRAFLCERLRIAVTVRTVGAGSGYRLSQVRERGNRRLVDVRPVPSLPPHTRVEGVLVLAPHELMCSKVLRMVARRKTPNAFVDLADLRRLLLAFPGLKTAEGAVADCLKSAGATEEALAAWKDAVAQDILPDDEDDKFAPWGGTNE